MIEQKLIPRFRPWLSHHKHPHVTTDGNEVPIPSAKGAFNNSSLPWTNGRYFADDIFRYIFVNEKFCILIKISLTFVPKGPIINIPALIPTMAWHRPGDKPLSVPTMVSLLTHICATRPHWVKSLSPVSLGFISKSIYVISISGISPETYWFDSLVFHYRHPRIFG